MRIRFLLLIGVGSLGFGPSCAPACGVSLVRRVPSPGERWEAVLYERSCGATTDFGTHLSVVRTGAKLPNKPGNVFIADSDHGRAPLVQGNVIAISIQWAGPDSLVVRYDRRARVFSQEPKVQGVSVQFVADAGGAYKRLELTPAVVVELHL